MTLKGQGQNDPWTTIEGMDENDLDNKLAAFVGAELPAKVAKTAAAYVEALNAQPGISIQRDRDQRAAQPAAAEPGPYDRRPTPSGPRPSLSSSLSPDAEGNYWINLPYQRNAALGAKQREHAKALGARFKKDEAPDPKFPWCVHQRFVSEENVAELLRLHETGFADIR